MSVHRRQTVASVIYYFADVRSISNSISHLLSLCYFGICYIGLFFRDAITLTCELRSLGVGGPRDVGGCPRVARKFSRSFPTFKIAITVIAILNVGNRLL